MVWKNKSRKNKKSPKFQWVVKTMSPPWIELPGDITANILGRLDVIDRLSSAYVCTTWRAVYRDYPHLWRVIYLSKSAYDHLNPTQLETVCRAAVYVSQKQLVDITMDGFCTNALLRYIAKRCSNLQRLRIAYCSKVSGSTLIKALKKLPMLNELYLFSLWSFERPGSFGYYFDTDDVVKAIGRFCPRLSSFTYTRRAEPNSMDPDDDVALGIAKHMPGLRHLSLLGDSMTEKGLEAILDGCPQLESLDIRLCINAEYDGLSEDKTERLRRQLRQFWLPRDSCSDHEYYERFTDFASWMEHVCEDGYYSPGYGWC